MKTLKKSLALLLALVMVVGTLAISASAAADNVKDYTDAAAAKESPYATAINVAVGLGVINGMSKTELGLDGTLTRGQAAKIATYLKLGESLANALPASNGGFTDVDAEKTWSAKYIAFCASKKIINGNGDGTFAPEGELTGYAFAKVLLVALGCGTADKEGNKYVGTYWMTEVAQDANKAGLFAGIKGVDFSKAISREVAMQMLYNAIMANVNDEYDAFDAAYEVVVSEPDAEGNVTYTVGDKVVAVAAAAPAYSFTAEAGKIKEKDVATINEHLGLKDDKALTVAENVKVVINDNVYETYEDVSIIAADEVDLFVSNKAVTEIKLTRYALAKIANVEDVKKDDKDAQAAKATKVITIEGAKVYDTNFAGTAEKGAWMLIAVKTLGETTKDNKIVASKAATIVTGKVDAIKGGNQYRIGGKYYSSMFELGIAGEKDPAVDYVLNAQGVIAAIATEDAVADTSKVNTYAYVYSIVKAAGQAGVVTGDGFATAGSEPTFTVYAVLSDGSKASFPAKCVKNEDDNKYYVGGIKVNDNDATKNENAVIVIEAPVVNGYKVDDKGFFSVVTENLSGEIKFVQTGTVNAKNSVVGGAYTNSKTLFIFTKLDAAKGTATVTLKTGYANANVAEQDFYYVAVANQGKTTIPVVFVTSEYKNPAAEVNPDLLTGYVKGDAIQTANGMEYTVVVDGTAKTVYTKADADALAQYVGQVVNFTLDSKNNVASVNTLGLQNNEISYVDGTQVVIAGATLSSEGAKVYKLDKDGNIVAGELKAGQTVTFAVKNDTIVFAYVMKDVQPQGGLQ